MTAPSLFRDDGMPSRVSETRPEVSNFQVRRPDTLQFASVEGLTSMAGVREDLLRRLIAKEVTDNALDERDRVGEGSVSIRRDGDDTYIVEDEGSGIPHELDKLQDLFSTNRPMVSGKFLRRPSRGTLGNGLRVLVAGVALSDGTITVESHGKRTTLQPRTTGSTGVIEQIPSRRKRGTRITYTLDEIIPYDDDDLCDAESAISVADAAGPAYARLPSPHWQDLDHLAGIFECIEPNETTVRQLVEQLDRCSGAKAGHIAEPFGKGRTCRSMRIPEIAELLRRMQDTAGVVRARSLGPIGDIFTDFDSYTVVEARLPHGAHHPRADIPVLIEAWASVRQRKGSETSLMIFCNRTPVVGNVWGVRGRDGIWLSGAGIQQYKGAMMKVPSGDCKLIVAITSPFIPITSLGKAPDLSLLQPHIVAALRRVFMRSRNRLPLDPKEPKPPKDQPPPRPPKPEPYEVSGPLATLLAEEAEQAGVMPGDLLVLSPAHDPFNESKASRRLAEWFVEQVERLLPKDKEVHLRGMYYRCLSAGDTLLPDGTPFIGSNANSALVEKAGKYARHLGLIPFDRINDERAAPPKLCVSDEHHAIVTDDPITRELIVTGCDPLSVPILDLVLPHINTDAAEIPRQPFRICFIGEKTSLGDVLQPIAEEVHGEMLLATGEVSEAAAYGIAKRAFADGRPLRILYFSDFDPAGWQMPISVARKLQAHICREFHDLDVQVIRVGLNIDQVNEFNLPDSPIKPGEKRAQAWRERWGREQVEIDALAALRPDVLDQIARDAVAAYFDPTFEGRYTEAVKLTDEELEWFSDQPAYSEAKAKVEDAHKRVDEATTDLNEAMSSAAKAMRVVVESEAAPDLSDVVIEPELDDELGQTIFDSSDDFVTATRKLQNLKALSAEDEDD